MLEANGSAAKDANFATAKTTTTSMDSANLDIFSQAMASAEIGDFSTAENISSKCLNLNPSFIYSWFIKIK